MLLASFYIQRDYIAANFCVNRYEPVSTCDGKCFLMQQLQENEEKERSLPDLEQKEIQLFVQQQIVLQQGKSVQSGSARKLIFQESLISSTFFSAIFHPPAHI